MAHQLKILVDDILEDSRYIRVADASSYDSRIDITNRVLKITIPGVEWFRIVNLPMGSDMTYTSKSLKLSKSLEKLNDGLWIFAYSVCPNEKVYVTVNHFRTVILERKLMHYLACIVHQDKPVSTEINNQMTECLLKLKGLKGNSINDFNTVKAYQLYSDIDKALDSINLINLDN